MDEKPATRRSIFAVWRWKRSVLISLALACSLVSYAAFYGLLVKQAVRVHSATEWSVVAQYPQVNANFPMPLRVPIYHILEPAHRIDRWLRPSDWSCEAYITSHSP